METKSLSKSFIIGLSILLGLFSLGFFIFNGLKTFSDKDRIVTVKGLAEMSLTATSASININYSFSGNNLQDIIKQNEIKKNSIIEYLVSIGYDKNEIIINSIDVTDRQKSYEIQREYGKQIRVEIDRYTIIQRLNIQSKDVKSTDEKTAQIKMDLISKDLTSNVTANYSFPELNSIKPKLIAESTQNARVAGEQFANDSHAKLGKIKTASQGQISIVGNYYSDEETGTSSQESNSSFIQKVRVVSTIVFFLE